MITINARDIFLNIVAGNRKGIQKGIYSICSANREVLEACFRQARSDNSIILIESTSNQVDQFGGYTGMRPSEFVSFVHSVGIQSGFPVDKILLGGDHLGPNAWQNLPATEAMSRASDLVVSYVRAGYGKIHLDTSMFCSDDTGDRMRPLEEDIVASRSAILCKVAEEAWEKYVRPGPAPIYIIGTEVPIPGGAKLKEEIVHPTGMQQVASTVEVFKSHFIKAGLANAWERVSGLVIQPGVEFGDEHVLDYKRSSPGLSREIIKHDNLVYEAHSTDYQAEHNLKAMVEDHFCILKVGPWLTFAYREALFALEAMEKEILGVDHPGLSGLSVTLENSMVKKPEYWKSYYHGNENEKILKRKYSFSDRSRYYWPDRDVENARIKLFKNLEKVRIPLSLLSQFMPEQFYQVCAGHVTIHPRDLVHSHIQTVTGIYARACGLTGNEK